MDKSWILKDRDSLEYESGVEQFLIYAEQNSSDPKNIPCPCGRCVNFKKLSVKIIRGHLYENGFSLGYVDWIWHGEDSMIRSSVASTCPATQNIGTSAPATETNNICDAAYNSSEYDKDSFEFKRFLADAEQPLFEGSECTKLESMLKLHNWKARFGISDSAFTDLLTSVGSLLPKNNVLPPNAYEAKKILSDLGLEYIKYHSCPNNCILYRGVNANASECPKCNLSRWKVGKDGDLRVNIPAKVMWYFPIIPRFKRMFKSPSTAELMTWHAKQRIQDGKMRHPADSPSWRNVDYRWPAFGNDARNIRLALSADGINPHNNGLTNRYSVWPVVLVTYNLPPWLCMKRKFMMLTILVSGPHEPGNNLDVYLQPLIDDLKKLWDEGEPNVYDAYSKSYFTMRAILFWTINDFPAYGNLSGCVNKGYMGCPVCGDDTVGKYLSHSRKMCYQGHRRYLAAHHPYRRQKAAFNGEQEFGHARQPLSGEEVLARQEQIKFEFGKEVRKSKKIDCPWKKKSVFFVDATGTSLQLPCDVEVFGVEKTIYVLHESIIELLEFKMIGQAAISAYMAYMHTVIRANNGLEQFAFCDPGATFPISSDFEAYIIRRLKEGNPDRIFFLPHNESQHWILLIIWFGEIFFLNPLSHRTYPHLEKSVTRAVQSFNIETGRGKKMPTVKYLIGSPKQPGGFECGYVVMRYIKEIIEDSSLSFEKKWARTSRICYGEKELDEVRFETLDYIQSHM